jgi:O-Antigen ligase
LLALESGDGLSSGWGERGFVTHAGVALVSVVLLPLVLCGVVACLRNPMGVGLPVFAALVPFGSKLSVGSSSFGSLSSIAGFVLGLGLLVQLLTVRRPAPRLSAAVPLWLLFCAVATATMWWTIDSKATVTGLSVLGSLAVVFVLVALSRADRTVVWRTENGLLAGGVVAVGYGLMQLTVLGGFPSKTAIAGQAATGAGRFGDDMLGADIEALALLLPLAIALQRCFDPARRRRARAGYGLVALLMVAGVLMTASRGGALAAGVTVLVLAAAAPRRAARLGLLACCLVAGVLGLVVYILKPAGVASRNYASVTTSSGRTAIWHVGLQACPRYCPLGAGWNTFPDVYVQTQSFTPGASVLVGPQGTYEPHDLWLLAVIDAGVAGLVLLALALGASLADAMRLPATLRGPPLSALVGVLVGTVFLSSLDFKFFWMTLIMVALNANVAASEAALPAVSAIECPRPVAGAGAPTVR